MPNHLPQRKSPRLQGYDYAQAGAYFITICTHHRAHLFGTIHDGVMHLSVAGEIAHNRWEALPNHHLTITLDAFVIMPNHMHGIVFIKDSNPAAFVSSQDVGKHRPGTLSAVVGSYKSGVTRRIRQTVNQPHLMVWQGRYHDHIIRSEESLNYIRQYVETNPACWQDDTFYSP